MCVCVDVRVCVCVCVLVCLLLPIMSCHFCFNGWNKPEANLKLTININDGLFMIE